MKIINFTVNESPYAKTEFPKLYVVKIVKNK